MELFTQLMLVVILFLIASCLASIAFTLYDILKEMRKKHKDGD